jgi:hypothetical protein
MNQQVEKRTNKAIIDQFNEAFINHDHTLLNDIIDINCRMEGASPPPDGAVVEGYENCLEFWKSLIESPNTQFVPDNVFVSENKATIQWKFMWGEKLENHIRGVTLITIRNGKVTEAIGYVKGNLS